MTTEEQNELGKFLSEFITKIADERVADEEKTGECICLIHTPEIFKHLNNFLSSMTLGLLSDPVHVISICMGIGFRAGQEHASTKKGKDIELEELRRIMNL